MDVLNTWSERIKNKNIREMASIAPIEDTSRKNRLRWLGLIQQRIIDATGKESERIPATGKLKMLGEGEDLN